jgi:hypothetical protein
MAGNAPRIIPLEEGWENEIKAKVRRFVGVAVFIALLCYLRPLLCSALLNVDGRIRPSTRSLWTRDIGR